jgi:charged multivesicular body protein 7
MPISDPLLSCRRTEKASAALKQNRKEIALGHLRTRKQLEDILVKRSKALENLESTLWTVEHAAGDVEVTPSRQISLDIQVLTLCS